MKSDKEVLFDAILELNRELHHLNYSASSDPFSSLRHTIGHNKFHYRDSHDLSTDTKFKRALQVLQVYGGSYFVWDKSLNRLSHFQDSLYCLKENRLGGADDSKWYNVPEQLLIKTSNRKPEWQDNRHEHLIDILFVDRRADRDEPEFFHQYANNQNNAKGEIIEKYNCLFSSDGEITSFCLLFRLIDAFIRFKISNSLTQSFLNPKKALSPEEFKKFLDDHFKNRSKLYFSEIKINNDEEWFKDMSYLNKDTLKDFINQFKNITSFSPINGKFCINTPHTLRQELEINGISLNKGRLTERTISFFSFILLQLVNKEVRGSWEAVQVVYKGPVSQSEFGLYKSKYETKKEHYDKNNQHSFLFDLKLNKENFSTERRERLEKLMRNIKLILGEKVNKINTRIIENIFSEALFFLYESQHQMISIISESYYLNKKNTQQIDAFTNKVIDELDDRTIFPLIPIFFKRYFTNYSMGYLVLPLASSATISSENQLEHDIGFVSLAVKDFDNQSKFSLFYQSDSLSTFIYKARSLFSALIFPYVDSIYYKRYIDEFIEGVFAFHIHALKRYSSAIEDMWNSFNENALDTTQNNTREFYNLAFKVTTSEFNNMILSLYNFSKSAAISQKNVSAPIFSEAKLNFGSLFKYMFLKRTIFNNLPMFGSYFEATGKLTEGLHLLRDIEDINKHTKEVSENYDEKQDIINDLISKISNIDNSEIDKMISWFGATELNRNWEIYDNLGSIRVPTKNKSFFFLMLMAILSEIIDNVLQVDFYTFQLNKEGNWLIFSTRLYNGYYDHSLRKLKAKYFCANPEEMHQRPTKLTSSIGINFEHRGFGTDAILYCSKLINTDMRIGCFENPSTIEIHWKIN